MFNRATNLSPDVERVEVLANRKDLDARTVTWKGGAVVASIAREFWITRCAYLSYCLRIDDIDGCVAAIGS